jgi:hypothetical protein
MRYHWGHGVGHMYNRRIQRQEIVMEDLQVSLGPQTENQQAEGPECGTRPGDTDGPFPLVEGNTNAREEHPGRNPLSGDDNLSGTSAGTKISMDLGLDMVAGADMVDEEGDMDFDTDFDTDSDCDTESDDSESASGYGSEDCSELLARDEMYGN